MYIPKRFEADSERTLLWNFLKENSFAVLSAYKDEKPIAVHIPLDLEIRENGDAFLMGHVSKGNKIWKCFDSNQKLLAIFKSVDAYISSSWYAKPNVPTWNYIAAHVYGTARVLEESEVRALLAKQINIYEALADTNPRMTMDKIPEKIMKADLRGLVGFEMKIESVDFAYKLSQNRDDKDYQNIIEELRKREDRNRGVADAMDKIRPKQQEMHSV